jgi:hypothetical protein
MSPVRRFALYFAVALTAALAAHAGGPSAEFPYAAFAALVLSATALAFATSRFSGGSSVVAASTAALYAAHPAFATLGRDYPHAPPSTVAVAKIFVAAAFVFWGAAVRRDAHDAAPPFRRDRRRLVETALYGVGAFLDVRLAAAPLLSVATHVWFRPDAPPAWRKSTLRTGAAQLFFAGVAGFAGFVFSGRGWNGDAGFFGTTSASLAAFGLDPNPSLDDLRVAATWAAALCAFLPAGLLSRRAQATRAVPLAIGLFGLWAIGGAAASSVAAAEVPTLGAVGLALGLPVLFLRAANALVLPRISDAWRDEPPPSVPALRDVVRGAPSLDAIATTAARRAAEAVVDALKDEAARRPDARWDVLLAPDRPASIDAETRVRGYVRDVLRPKLGDVGSVLILGDPPPAAAAELASRAKVEVRLSAGAVDGAARFSGVADVFVRPIAAPVEPATFDAAIVFAGSAESRVDATLALLATARRAVKRGGPVAAVPTAADDALGLAAWFDSGDAS